MMTSLLDKLSTRNALSIGLTGLFGYVLWFILNNLETISENPVLMLVLGILATNFNIIIVFYFRKAQSKESVSK